MSPFRFFRCSIFSPPLPPFDQAQVDKRFLTELARLLEIEAFSTYRAWAATVGVSASYLAAIGESRYHANRKLLYETLRYYPAYVLFGSAVDARPEPTEVPKRARGPRPKSATT